MKKVMDVKEAKDVCQDREKRKRKASMIYINVIFDEKSSKLLDVSKKRELSKIDDIKTIKEVEKNTKENENSEIAMNEETLTEIEKYNLKTNKENPVIETFPAIENNVMERENDPAELICETNTLTNNNKINKERNFQVWHETEDINKKETDVTTASTKQTIPLKSGNRLYEFFTKKCKKQKDNALTPKLSKENVRLTEIDKSNSNWVQKLQTKLQSSSKKGLIAIRDIKTVNKNNNNMIINTEHTKTIDMWAPKDDRKTFIEDAKKFSRKIDDEIRRTSNKLFINNSKENKLSEEKLFDIINYDSLICKENENQAKVTHENEINSNKYDIIYVNIIDDTDVRDVQNQIHRSEYSAYSDVSQTSSKKLTQTIFKICKNKLQPKASTSERNLNGYNVDSSDLLNEIYNVSDNYHNIYSDLYCDNTDTSDSIKPEYGNVLKRLKDWAVHKVMDKYEEQVSHLHKDKRKACNRRHGSTERKASSRAKDNTNKEAVKNKDKPVNGETSNNPNESGNLLQAISSYYFECQRGQAEDYDESGKKCSCRDKSSVVLICKHCKLPTDGCGQKSCDCCCNKQKSKANTKKAKKKKSSSSVKKNSKKKCQDKDLIKSSSFCGNECIPCSTEQFSDTSVNKKKKKKKEPKPKKPKKSKSNSSVNKKKKNKKEPKCKESSTDLSGVCCGNCSDVPDSSTSVDKKKMKKKSKEKKETKSKKSKKSKKSEPVESTNCPICTRCSSEKIQLSKSSSSDKKVKGNKCETTKQSKSNSMCSIICSGKNPNLHVLCPKCLTENANQRLPKLSSKKTKGHHRSEKYTKCESKSDVNVNKCQPQRCEQKPRQKTKCKSPPKCRPTKSRSSLKCNPSLQHCLVCPKCLIPCENNESRKSTSSSSCSETTVSKTSSNDKESLNDNFLVILLRKKCCCPAGTGKNVPNVIKVELPNSMNNICCSTKDEQKMVTQNKGSNTQLTGAACPSRGQRCCNRMNYNNNKIVQVSMKYRNNDDTWPRKDPPVNQSNLFEVDFKIKPKYGVLVGENDPKSSTDMNLKLIIKNNDNNLVNNESNNKINDEEFSKAISHKLRLISPLLVNEYSSNSAYISRKSTHDEACKISTVKNTKSINKQINDLIRNGMEDAARTNKNSNIRKKESNTKKSVFKIKISQIKNRTSIENREANNKCQEPSIVNDSLKILQTNVVDRGAIHSNNSPYSNEETDTIYEDINQEMELLNVILNGTNDNQAVEGKYNSTRHKKRVSCREETLNLTEILQSKETKKAVLKLYTKTTRSKKHLIAKLPKFRHFDDID